jgi:UDP-GlcNAc:undecaprenyl-phosphate GlcNAc-1-phosphate transferase
LNLPPNSLLLIGLLAGLGASWLAIRFIGPRGWIDAPDDRKHHRAPTALTGGLALWAVLVGGTAAGWLRLPLHPEDWAAIHVMAAMGVLDDRFNLRARYKALVGLLVALLMGWHAAETLAATGGPMFRVAYFEMPNRLAYTMPLAVAWFWGIPQAFNLIDGLNGLSLGLTALLLGLLGWGAGSEAALLVGAVLGALLLNYPRARHFIGDCGAFLLGTLLAILALKRGLPTHPNLALWAFAYPILDVTVVVAIRLARRQGLAIADHNHLHDWMVARLGGGPWARPLATPLLLLLAAGPMLHELPWRHGQTAGLVGLIVLIAVGIDQFRIGLGAPLPEKDEDDGPSMNGALPENTRAS